MTLILKAKLVDPFFHGGVAAGYYNINNFGDQITPDILVYFGARVFHCPKFRNADLVGVGSILHMVPSDYKGYILGSGLIDKKFARVFPSANALLVRGYLTKKLCELPASVRVGDPGLIADSVYEKYLSNEKTWEIGIVPHFYDFNSSRIAKLIQINRDDILLIDVRRPPRSVIRDISKCNYILSSSLHGLIIADSLGIPNRWLHLSNRVEGDGFKFRDYYSCFNREETPIRITGCEKILGLISKTRLAEADAVEGIKESINSAFSEFLSQ